MTSDRRIEANRRNARKSTGPKSAGGRLRSSANATRHGLTALNAAGDDAPEIAALASALAAQGPALIELATDAARAHFAVVRVRRATVEALDAAYSTAVAGDGGDVSGSDAAALAVVACVGTVRKYWDYERRAVSRRKAALRRLEAEIARRAL